MEVLSAGYLYTLQRKLNISSIVQFSSMKLVKTRLKNRMGEDTLDSTIHICFESPDLLMATHWKIL